MGTPDLFGEGTKVQKRTAQRPSFPYFRPLLVELGNHVATEDFLRGDEFGELLVVHKVHAQASLGMGFHASRVLHGLAEGVHVELDDFVRRSGGHHEAAGGTVPLAIVAEFPEGGDVGIFGQAFLGEDAEDAQFGLAAAHEVGDVRNLGAGEVHFALTQGKQLVGGAAVGDGLVLEIGGAGEELGGGVVGGFHAVGRAAVGRLFLAGLHQVAQSLPRAVGGHDHDAGFGQMVAKRDDVLYGEGGARLHGQRGERGQVDEADGLSIGLGVDEFRPADLAVAAGQVVDDERLADVFFGLRSQQTGPGVRAGTGFIGHDDVHVAFGSPRMGGKGHRQQRGGDQGKKCFHDVLLRTVCFPCPLWPQVRTVTREYNEGIASRDSDVKECRLPFVD